MSYFLETKCLDGAVILRLTNRGLTVGRSNPQRILSGEVGRTLVHKSVINISNNDCSLLVFLE